MLWQLSSSLHQSRIIQSTHAKEHLVRYKSNSIFRYFADLQPYEIHINTLYRNMSYYDNFTSITSSIMLFGEKWARAHVHTHTRTQTRTNTLKQMERDTRREDTNTQTPAVEEFHKFYALYVIYSVDRRLTHKCYFGGPALGRNRYTRNQYALNTLRQWCCWYVYI